jgi:hypothetical protein
MKTNLTQINLLKNATVNCFAAYHAFILTFRDFDKSDPRIDFTNPQIEEAIKDVCSTLKCFILAIGLFNDAPKSLKAGLPQEYIDFIQSDLVSQRPIDFLNILEQRDVSFIDFQIQVKLFEIVLKITDTTIENIKFEELFLDIQDN